MNMRVVMQKTDKRGDQISYYRFFNNKRVTEEALIGCATEHCAAECSELEEVVLIEDTTELNLERHRERITDKEGLGQVGNGTDWGFFAIRRCGEIGGEWRTVSAGLVAGRSGGPLFDEAGP
jgi:hypothetical protein